MIEVSRARHIGPHSVKPCFALSHGEIQFVLNFPGLNHLAKLVWIVLAAMSEQNPDFTCQYSFQQFAKMLGQSPGSVLRAIKQLEAVGIVQAMKGDVLGDKSPIPNETNNKIDEIKQCTSRSDIAHFVKGGRLLGGGFKLKDPHPLALSGRDRGDKIKDARRKNSVLINLIRKNEQRNSTFGFWDFLCLFANRRGRINFAEVWGKIH